MKKILSISVLLSSFLSVQALAAGEHKGLVEGGMVAARGNTDNDNFNGKVGMNSRYGKVVNEFAAVGYGSSASGTRSGEKYAVNDKLKYEFTDVDYGFAEADWANDRFAGYSQRLSGIAGAGHYFMKEPNLGLYGELGAGYRQTDYIPIASNDEESAVGKVGGGLNWKINEYVEFNQTADSVFGEENVVTTSDTSVKSFLNKQLYLKMGYNWQNMSEAPATKKKTDSITTLSVGYNF